MQCGVWVEQWELRGPEPALGRACLPQVQSAMHSSFLHPAWPQTAVLVSSSGRRRRSSSRLGRIRRQGDTLCTHR
jgi:hypothetical protein